MRSIPTLASSKYITFLRSVTNKAAQLHSGIGPANASLPGPTFGVFQAVIATQRVANRKSCFAASLSVKMSAVGQAPKDNQVAVDNCGYLLTKTINSKHKKIRRKSLHSFQPE